MAKKFRPGLNGETLKRVREAIAPHVSQSELSTRVGKHRGWASKVEHNNTPITLETARAVAAVADCDVSVFGVASDAAPRVFNFKLVKEEAQRRGLSIRSLAGLIGVNVVNSYKWMNQGAQPSKANMELLAETLELSLDELYVVKKGLDVLPSDASDTVEPVTDSLQASHNRLILVPMHAGTYRRLKDAIAGFEGHDVSPVSLEALRPLLALLSVSVVLASLASRFSLASS